MKREMLFQTAVFKDGVNLTVRRGLKWADLKGREFLYTDGVIQCFAEKVKVKRFKDISDDELRLEHDKLCENRDNLLEVMKRLYPGFDSNEIVTLVFFNCMAI